MTASVAPDEAIADAAAPSGLPRQQHSDAREGLRHLVDFVLVILIAAIVFRGFVAEGYYVPTGSMAPNLLGFHHHARCPRCGKQFDVGIDDSHWSSEATCPICLAPVPIDTQIVESGDRLLVLKSFFDVRSPRRWQTIVFRNPNDAAQAYVKRVVGLPGESIRLDAGDVFINGQIARKTLDELLRMCLCVYDHDFGSKADSQPARFVSLSSPGGWRQEGSTLRIDATDSAEVQTIAYRHLDERGNEIPVNDFNGYNADWGGRHEPVTDLILRLTASHSEGDGWLGLRYDRSTSASFEFRLFPASGRVEFWRDGELRAESRIAPWPGEVRTLTMAYWDRRIGLRVGTENPFPDDFDLDDVQDLTAAAATRPFRIAAQKAGWLLERIRIDRDVHYGSQPHGGFAISSEYRLKDGEYFVLGDNSWISNDSRSWITKAVPESLLIGKPLFVHLPTRVWRTTLLGRPIQLSIPDVTRMRIVR